MTDAAAPDRPAWRNIPVGLFGVTLLFRAAQNAAQTTLAPIGEVDLHASATTVGLLSALTGACAVVASVALGRLAPPDRVRRWLDAGLVVTAASLLVVALAPDLAVLAVGAAALGVGGGLVMPSLTTLVAGGRGSVNRTVAAFTLVLSVSLAVGPLLESALIAASGGSLRVPLVVFAVTPLAGLLVSPALRARRAGKVAPVPVPDPPSRDLPSGDPTLVGAYTPVWRRPGWRLATAGQLLYQVPFVAVVVFALIAGRQVFGLTISASELGLTVFFLASMSTRLALTWHGRVAHAREVLLGAAALTLLGVALLAFAPGPGAYFAGLAVLGVPHGVTFPVGLSLIAEETPPALLSRANAAFSAWTTGASVGLPALLGVAAGVLGLRDMFAVALAPVAVMTVVIATGGRSRAAPSPAAPPAPT